MHCSFGLTAAHGHSCLGRPGPAWPGHGRGLWLAHGAMARQSVVTTLEHVQRAARHGARWLAGGLNPKPALEKRTRDHGHCAATPKAGRE
jgi:hypothetical protein